MPVGGQPRVDPRRRRSTKERDTRLRADTHHLVTELHIVHTSRWRTFSRSSHLTAPFGGYCLRMSQASRRRSKQLLRRLDIIAERRATARRRKAVHSPEPPHRPQRRARAPRSETASE